MTTKTGLLVTYNEVDGMGVVHHSNYLLWFEKGRRDHLKKAGVSNSQIVSQGFFLPLTELECNFRSPARQGDTITVFTKILSMSCVKLKFEYMVYDEKKGKLLATGKTVHAWTNQRIEPINKEKAAPGIYQRLKQFSDSQDIL